MLLLIIFLFLSGLLLLWIARQDRKASGLPAGRVIYVDTSAWGKVETPLYDPELRLAGKPDYLVAQGEAIIPVEVKRTQAPEAPYPAHILQLAAYCRLVQVAYGKRPAYGILHYPTRTFAIDYTPALERTLLDQLSELRAREQQTEVDRSHQSQARCQACGYRAVCDQKLI